MVKSTRESGRTMIETLGVLAIIGILTIGSIGLYSIAMRQLNRSQAVQDVQLLVQQIRSVFSGAEDYSRVDSGIIIASGLKEANPFGGKYVVTPGKTDTKTFDIQMTGLGKSDCEYFKIYNWEDSVEHQKTKQGGATAQPVNCNDANSQNIITITYR